MTPSEIDNQLVRLASDDAGIYEDAQRWFLARRADIAPALVAGLDRRGLGSVGRWRILLLLRELALPSTLPAILQAFRSAVDEQNPIVLPGAMEALAVFDDEEAMSALMSVLASDDRDVVNHAAALIGSKAGKAGTAGGPRAQAAQAAQAALVALTDLLRHPDAARRQSAVRGLLLMDQDSAREVLRQHRTQERDPGVLKLLRAVR
jgi:HEAT repeat protein